MTTRLSGCAAVLLLAAAALGCGAPLASGDDEDVDELEAELSACGHDPQCSIGRPKAILEVPDGTVYEDALTSTGRRDLSETEVNGGGQSYLSGCRNDFCAIYWVNGGAGAYANVPRSQLRVWSKKKQVWSRADDIGVRRLGGPPVASHTVERRLVAGDELRDIWHPTHGGEGEAPMLGYSCTNSATGRCDYVTGADAPPNTSHDGKGYVTGIYKSGKVFHSSKRRVLVDAFRKSDGAPGKLEWIYGYVDTEQGKVWMWVIRSARIRESSGKWTVYPGYVRKP